MTTAVHADAPPILKWDAPDERNPFAWYLYPYGSEALMWHLFPGSWVDVTAVVPSPTLWGSVPMPHLGAGVMLTLAGAVDTNERQGNCLFPECLKSELHSVRSTIESYSKHAKLTGREGAPNLASGYSPHAEDGGIVRCECSLTGSGQSIISTAGTKSWAQPTLKVQ